MTKLIRNTQLQVNRRGAVVDRRTMLQRCVGAGAMAAGVMGAWRGEVALHANELRSKHRACILLWMQGGPSQFETFSPLPNHANGGGTKAIATSVPGIQIAETMPRTAKAMEDTCLIRSMSSKEGSHPRATFLMQTGYLPNASVKHPALGAHASMQLGDPEADIPEFVRIGQGRVAAGGGLLGVQHNPLVVQQAGGKPQNASTVGGNDQFRRRMRLFEKVNAAQSQAGSEQEVLEQAALYESASRLTLSPKMDAFELERESAATRELYGESPFGAGCLLARRLVEAGVSFVEVSAGNWDTHFDNASRTKELCAQVDQPYAALLADLKGRGMLDDTLVVWMGEFGRTPRINGRGGRDHYPRAFSIALAGGGVRGGQVIGEVDSAGVSVANRPVGVSDLFQTICHSLRIDANIENLSGIGRPIRVVDGGEVIDEVFTG